MSDSNRRAPVLRLPGFTVSISRGPAPSARARRHSRIVPALRGAALVAGALVATGITAYANPTPDPNSTTIPTQVTISPPVKSVSVSLPNNETILPYGSCSGGTSTASALGFPNATCSTAQYTVHNSGNVDEQIDVAGSVAQPSDGSTNQWALCNPVTLPCAGTNGLPGANQYENIDQGATTSTYLQTSLQQDFAVTSSTLAPGQSTTEALVINGPQSTTDQSTTFVMTVVYTAV